MSYFPLRVSDERSNLAVPPPVPSAFDDEFEGFSLDAKWTAEGTISGSPVVTGASFASADQRHDYGRRRRSHLSIQNGADSTWRGISQLMGASLPLGLYWVRFQGEWVTQSTAGNNGNLLFGLSASSGANWDLTNGMFLNVVENDNTQNNVQGGTAGGGSGSNTWIGMNQRSMGWRYWAMLLSAANTVDVFACDEAGGWQWWNRMVYTGGATLDRVVIGQLNTSTLFGNRICLLDFFRYSATVDMP